jgi:hypothetical protein
MMLFECSSCKHVFSAADSEIIEESMTFDNSDVFVHCHIIHCPKCYEVDLEMHS